MRTKWRAVPYEDEPPAVMMFGIFTFDGFRSPTIRSRGPVILIISAPAKNFVAVREITSPKPAAEASRIDGVPYKIPRWYIGKRGSKPDENAEEAQC
jgi:hypothetical protein